MLSRCSAAWEGARNQRGPREGASGAPSRIEEYRMARRSVRAGLTAGVLALALIASACGDSGDDSSSSPKSEDSGAGTNEALQKTDCGTLEHDKDAPKGGTFTDYAMLSDSGSNTSFDPGVVQTLSES